MGNADELSWRAGIALILLGLASTSALMPLHTQLASKCLGQLGCACAMSMQALRDYVNFAEQICACKL